MHEQPRVVATGDDIRDVAEHLAAVSRALSSLADAVERHRAALTSAPVPVEPLDAFLERTRPLWEDRKVTGSVS